MSWRWKGDGRGPPGRGPPGTRPAWAASRPSAQLARGPRRLARLAFTAPTGRAGQAWRQQLDALREVKENLESELAGQNGAFRPVQAARGGAGAR